MCPVPHAESGRGRLPTHASALTSPVLRTGPSDAFDRNLLVGKFKRKVRSDQDDW